MSKVEGDLYEAIAKKWFKANNFIVKKYQPAYGVDFLVSSPDEIELWYEVKGKQLVDVYKRYKSFRITGFEVKNVERKKIDFYLVIIYDNFSDIFRIFNIEKNIIEKLLRRSKKGSPYISFYRLFEALGVPILFDINDIDIEKRRFKF